ncbi:MAG: hypothetical protein B6I36_00285 [Desulfobacteraceae bacterium 4572_35.1]|nr:MAG: hypothetical protein B6I36_00285 [Desulfobacteraceae bacterium 4572_35.1]
MNQLIFNVKISSENYLKFYQGQASWVNIVAEDGRRLKLPAKHLRPYLTHAGINGRFLLQFDNNSKMTALKRLK